MPCSDTKEIHVQYSLSCIACTRLTRQHENQQQKQRRGEACFFLSSVCVCSRPPIHSAFVLFFFGLYVHSTAFPLSRYSCMHIYSLSLSLSLSPVDIVIIIIQWGMGLRMRVLLFFAVYSQASYSPYYEACDTRKGRVLSWKIQCDSGIYSVHTPYIVQEFT